MTVEEPFAPRGHISIIAACEELIKETPEKEGFSYTVAVTEIQARTGLEDLVRSDIMGPMLAASKRLRRDGIPGVKNLRGTGWQRETAKDLMTDAVARAKKVSRQTRWMGDSAAAADPEQLDWPDREKRTEIQRKAQAVDELYGRRSRRLRPLPPAESA